jgi:hypothetical protein
VSGRIDLGARLGPALTACIGVAANDVRASHLMLLDLDAVLTHGQWSLGLDRHDLRDACRLGQINRAGVTAAWASRGWSLRLTRKQPRRMTTWICVHRAPRALGATDSSQATVINPLTHTIESWTTKKWTG